MRINTGDVFETLDTQKEDAKVGLLIVSTKGDGGDRTGGPMAELLAVVEKRAKAWCEASVVANERFKSIR